MDDYKDKNNDKNNGVINGHGQAHTSPPYSVNRYETTSGPWHNILDVPGTDTWVGQPVYNTGDSPSGSAVALYGSIEDLTQPEKRDGNGSDKHKKKDKKGAKSSHKKDDKGESKKDKKDKRDRGDTEKRHRSHQSHGHGHSSQAA